MKKILASITIAAAILAACNTATPIPMPTDIPVLKVEPLEKKLMGVSSAKSSEGIIIGLAYDTNGNFIPDTFELYSTLYNEDVGWFQLNELLSSYTTDDAGIDF